MSLALYIAWPAEDPGQALRRALDHALAAPPGGLAGRALRSMLIDAAGAPPPDAVAGLLADLASRFVLVPDLEATLAIAPQAITLPDLSAFQAAGITRLALRAGPSAALLAAARTRFASTAVDLAFGHPGQTLAAWRKALAHVLHAGADHISIEEAPLADGQRVDPDHVAALYQDACDVLREAGLPAYEIGHFAKPGHESRHHLHGATGGDYLGIGPGAVGRITGEACYALRQVAPAAAWLRAVASGTEARHEVLTPGQRHTELILTGLRLRAGIGRDWFEPLVGCPLEETLDRGRLAALVGDGFLVLDRRGLRLSDRGWPLCDAVLARLLA